MLQLRPFIAFLFGFFFLFAVPLAAQDLPFDLEVPLEDVTGYSEDIPRPEEVIGHEIGTQHTAPHQVVRYFEAVAEASDRVELEGHGQTYEGRKLIHAFVTTPENLGQLESIREANVRLSEDPSEVSDAELQNMPAVVNMGYSIHGDEASGTEAAVLLLYHLAAGEGPAVEEVLENAVVIVDPMFNPDGRDRFVDWANRNRGGVHTTDPQNREHNQPWPGGRTNHYWFDLNRDWLPAQHPASQGRVELFQRWRPQVLTDFHEMGSDDTYFFQPGIPSRTNPNTPDRNQELTAEIAEYHAEILDQIGSFYYTEEAYDDFYYGKGSTYPDLNGSIGILFEQASSRALERETDRGLLHYAFTVRNQFASSLSTLKAVAEMRETLLRYHRDFYAETPEVTQGFSMQAYVIDSERDETRAQALKQLLDRHQIRMHELASDLEADGQNFRAGEAFVVPVDQRQGRLVKAFMERTTEFPDSLFYDVSTWTLPLAFNLDYAELEGNPEGYLGTEIDDIDFGGGQLVGRRSDYAYVMAWGSYFAPRALHRFQEAGVLPRVMTEGFEARVGGQERSFPRGSIIIPVEARSNDPHAPSPEDVQEIVQEVVEKDHVTIYAVESGLTADGPDLGSRGASVLKKPEIALITGQGASAYNAGEVWHLLSERFEIPVSLLDTDQVSGADLSRYNTIVMAGGYGSYGGLPEDKIESWIEDGGRLITLASASNWAVNNELVELEEREIDLDSLFQDRPYDELDDAYGAQQIGGTIFEAGLDVTHPLAYGYDESVPVFRSGNTFYEPSKEPGTNVAVYSDEPRLSGYISDEMMEQARGGASIVADRLGSGRVILFMDNPNFRAFWYGTNGLFLNAIFFGGAF